MLWGILDKIRSNLSQECAKGGLLSFQGKIGTIDFNFPVVVSFALLFYLFP